MKNILAHVALYLTLLFCFTQCNEKEVSPEEDAAQKLGKITFTYQSLKKPGQQGGVDQVKQPHRIQLSLINAKGEKVISNQSLELISSEDGLITKELELATGKYTLEEFILMDDNGNVLQAAPKTGSPFASFLGSPLPISFEITRSNMFLTQQVLPVNKNNIAEQFGYASFGFEDVDSFSDIVDKWVLIESNSSASVPTPPTILLLTFDQTGTYTSKFFNPIDASSSNSVENKYKIANNNILSLESKFWGDTNYKIIEVTANKLVLEEVDGDLIETYERYEDKKNYSLFDEWILIETTHLSGLPQSPSKLVQRFNVNGVYNGGPYGSIFSPGIKGSIAEGKKFTFISDKMISLESQFWGDTLYEIIELTEDKLVLAEKNGGDLTET
jgi:hypothetical protein